jgi:hypothetical protein
VRAVSSCDRDCRFCCRPGTPTEEQIPDNPRDADCRETDPEGVASRSKLPPLVIRRQLTRRLTFGPKSSLPRLDADWARNEGPVESRATGRACGVAASGELSLAMGLRHPDLYGAVFSASPGGGYRPPAVMPRPLPRAYLVAGTLEPFFLENATRWAGALREAGADVVMTERVGNHGDPFWAADFPLMVAWAFGR